MQNMMDIILLTCFKFDNRIYVEIGFLISGCTHKTKVWDLLHRACTSGNTDQLSVALKVSPLHQEGIIFVCNFILLQ